MSNLTSVRLQPMINIDNPELELLCPTLIFGGGKSARLNFPIVFKDEKPATDLYNELQLLIGKSLAEVKSAAESLYDKYEKFHYKKCN